MPSLMDRAMEGAPAQQPQGAPAQAAPQDAAPFQRPDLSKTVPPDMKDAVDRVVAAGMKIMYSKEMRQEVIAEIQRDVPTAQKLGEAVSGLILMLDQQAEGGIPVNALFPAAMELLGEAAEMLVKANMPVSQDDYNTAAMHLFVILGRKMGATDEQLMSTAQQFSGQGGGQPAEQPPQPGAPQGGM